MNKIKQIYSNYSSRDKRVQYFRLNNVLQGYHGINQLIQKIETVAFPSTCYECAPPKPKYVIKEDKREILSNM